MPEKIKMLHIRTDTALHNDRKSLVFLLGVGVSVGQPGAAPGTLTGSASQLI